MAKSRSHVVQVNVQVPPPDPRPFVPPITLPGNRETAFLALHASVTGFLMHWVANQPLVHVKDREWCGGCKMGQTPRWTGFLGVVSLSSYHRFILQIPAAAFRNSGPFRERSDAGHLAGTTFTSYRFGHTRSRTNPAVIELIEHPYSAPKMVAFPLFAALCRLWNRETLDLVDVVNRPEDAELVRAEEFIRFADKVKAHDAQRKGAKP